MATFVVFNQARIDILTAVHNFLAHTFRMGFVSSAQAVALTDANPRWSGGGTNYSANQVSGGNVPSGGVTLGSPTVAGSPTVVDFADAVINQNGANPTNARRAIVYNDSDANKRAVGFIDFGADQDLSAGNNTITIANGLFDMSGN